VLEEGRYEKAFNCFLDIFRQHPNDEDAICLAAQALHENLDQPKHSVIFLDRILDEHPTFKKVIRKRVELSLGSFASEQQIQQAIDELKKGLGVRHMLFKLGENIF
jgi:tetratricopeptide (TPR) repeat protein